MVVDQKGRKRGEGEGREKKGSNELKVGGTIGEWERGE